MNRWNRVNVLATYQAIDAQRLSEGILTPISSRDIRTLRKEGADFRSTPSEGF